MKTKEEIEVLAKRHCNIKEDLIIDEEERYYKDFQKYDGYVEGYTKCQEDNKDKKYTEEDMINASKYGYEFRDTTSFPKHKFEDDCINNTKQWLAWYNEQDK